MFNLPGYPAASVTIERPCLYVVATPIGNLGDITLRALQILEQVEVVFAEDTRTSIKLLDRYGINRPLESLHQQNESARAEQIAERIKAGPCAVALVSDAGTPLVSDPGYVVARTCQNAGILVRYVPGASAVLGALVVSGLPCDRFAFEGFLPTRQAARSARLNALKDESRTTVYFEAPHRIRDTLADMRAVFGAPRAVCVVRELTKLHETVYRGNFDQVLAAMESDAHSTRGEFAIVVAADAQATYDAEVPTRLLTSLLTRLSRRDAVEVVSEATGYPRNLLYALALEMKKSS